MNLSIKSIKSYAIGLSFLISTIALAESEAKVDPATCLKSAIKQCNYELFKFASTEIRKKYTPQIKIPKSEIDLNENNSETGQTILFDALSCNETFPIMDGGNAFRNTGIEMVTQLINTSHWFESDIDWDRQRNNEGDFVLTAYIYNAVDALKVSITGSVYYSSRAYRHILRNATVADLEKNANTLIDYGSLDGSAFYRVSCFDQARSRSLGVCKDDQASGHFLDLLYEELDPKKVQAQSEEKRKENCRQCKNDVE